MNKKLWYEEYPKSKYLSDIVSHKIIFNSDSNRKPCAYPRITNLTTDTNNNVQKQENSTTP